LWHCKYPDSVRKITSRFSTSSAKRISIYQNELIKNSLENLRNVPVQYCTKQCCGPGSGAFLPPGSGINYFRIPDRWIPDPEGMFFGEFS
jgi:hypothetical protein